LDLLANLPNTLERTQQEHALHIALGGLMIAAKGWAAPEVAAVYRRARELCQHVGETPQLFSALAGLYRFYVVRGEYEQAQELAEQLLRLAQRFQDQALLLAAHGMMGYIRFLRGGLSTAQEHLEQSIAFYDPQRHRFFALLSGDDPGVASLSFSAWALWLRGYPDQALRKSHEALSLAQQLAHPNVLMTALGLAAQFHYFRREWSSLLQDAEALVALAAKQGFPLWIAVGTILLNGAWAGQGQGTKGMIQMEQGFTTLQSIGVAALSSYWALLAETYERCMQAKKGLDVTTKVLADIGKSGERFYEAELYRLKGELLLQLLSITAANPA
jgi:adenylate cyclase